MKTLTLLFAAMTPAAMAAPSPAKAQAWPNKPIRVITANSAGGTSDIFVRALGDELQDEAFFLGSYKPMKIRHAPSHYMKMLYIDTVCYNTPAVKMVLDWMGPDRVLYGSDAPPLTSLKPRAIKLIHELDIPAADKEKIFWTNARRLLKLN